MVASRKKNKNMKKEYMKPEQRMVMQRRPKCIYDTKMRKVRGNH